MQTTDINQVILGNSPITSELAIMLERVLGTSAQTWKNLESHYQLFKTKWANKQKLIQEKAILKKPVIIELKKRGVIESGDTLKEIESVLKFFGAGTIDALYRTCDAPYQAALRHSPSFKSDPLMVTAWLRLAEREAVKQDCKSFDKTLFRNALESIRSLTQKLPQHFVPEMIRLCADAGVSLVFVPEFKGGKINGATKWLTTDKAMLAVNLRGKTNDIFWFTFFHEAGHILYDKSLVIETTDQNVQKSKSEELADKFASSFLIPNPEKLTSLKSEKDIRNFASKIGIDPGIVVGRMHHEKLLPYHRFAKLKTKLIWKDD